MGNIKELDGATLEDLGGRVYELVQDFVTEDGEDVRTVAQDMIGPKGSAILVSVFWNNPAGPYHTATYRGSKKSLEALHAKFSGSRIGRPPKEETAKEPVSEKVHGIALAVAFALASLTSSEVIVIGPGKVTATTESGDVFEISVKEV